jgi:hypothetical protein
MGTNRSRRLQDKQNGSNLTTKALIEFTDIGRVENICIVGENEKCQAIVEYGLERLTKPSHWSWLKRRIGRKSEPWG